MSRQAPTRKSKGGGDGALRVIIADKSDHFRDTLHRVLRQHPKCAVVGDADSLLDAVRLVATAAPNLCLLDIDLVMNENPGRLRRLADAFPFLRVIVMLNEESTEYRLAVAERWGYRCIVKDRAEQELESLVGDASRAVA